MTVEHVVGKGPSRTRKASSEPPGFDRAASAFRRSGRVHVALAILTAACGLALAAGALSGYGGDSGAAVFLAAGGFVLVLALVPLIMGLRRTARVAFLTALRHRWAQLGTAGDPDDQIATLRRAYAGLVGNDLRTRVTSTP